MILWGVLVFGVPSPEDSKWSLEMGEEKGPSIALVVAREPSAVVFSWTLTHAGEGPIWIADVMLTGTPRGVEALADRAVVRQPPAAGAPLRITVGYTAPYAMVFRELRPVARRVEPGDVVAGRVRVPLPLSSFHPMELDTSPIENRPTDVVVAFGYWTGAPSTVRMQLASSEWVEMLSHGSLQEQHWVELTAHWP